MSEESSKSSEPGKVETKPPYLVLRNKLDEGREYMDFETSSDSDPVEKVVDLSQYVNKDKGGWQCKETLGLHLGMNGKIRSSHFVGAVWLDPNKKISMVVKPKIESVDAVKMFTEVATNSDLFGDISSIFKCYPDQPLINGKPLEELSLLQVAVYLKRLVEFCRRDLRFGFIRVNENLTGKVKGKILVGMNLRRNTLRGRLDRVFCQYQLFSMDTLENQILKAALWISRKVLAKYNSSVPGILWQWAKQCESALATVSLKRIEIADFRGLVYSGFMIRYKEPHALAKMIIRRFRVDAEGEVKEEKDKTVPFYLDMNALFERYVGVKLRKMGLKIEYPPKEVTIQGERLSLSIKPDFVSLDGQTIVDAKYKALVEEEIEDEIVWKDKVRQVKIIRNDIYQVIAYATLLSHENSKWSKDVVLAIPVQDDNKIRKFENWEKFQNSTDISHLILKLPGNHQIRLAILFCPLPIKPVKDR